jgi:hypothetical protein
MSVPLGHGDRLVAEDFLQYIEVASGHNKLAGERVPEVVKVQISETSPAACV